MGLLVVNSDYERLYGVPETPDPSVTPDPGPVDPSSGGKKSFAIYPYLYHGQTGIEYEDCSNEQDPITSIPNEHGIYLLKLKDNSNNYVTDDNCTVGDMTGYVSVQYDSEEHGWVLWPFSGWTAESYQESGLGSEGSLYIDIEYHDPETGEQIIPQTVPTIYWNIQNLTQN